VAGLVSFAGSPAVWAAQSESASGTIVSNRPPLQPNAFNPLPLGAVRPAGWLERQLRIQANGLTGNLDEFWNDVGPNSGWLGGTGESWERGPYYLDGLLPLAYQLKDARLIARAKRWVDWTLTHQQTNGQIGPPSNDDWWPRMVMLKVLTQYEEASGDSRVIPVMTRYFEFELRELPGRPLRDWGKYRWQDNLYSVLWLYNRTGEKNLLNLAALLHKQGYDWETQFANFQYTTKQTAEKLGLKPHTMANDRAMQTHGVNNAMALKTAPVWWLVSGNVNDRSELGRQLAELDRYHGLPNGMFSGDEHLAGPDPSQGIELCAVVESMFSYEADFAILGDPRLLDRLERVAYNALPATLSNDMWSHQYDQQPNQISCTRAHRQWSTNGDQSNLFGLAPNFGCCTANLHQGWPKFVTSLWMATADNDGLVAAAYAPSVVQTRLKGNRVSIEERTEYPFRDRVRFIVHTDRPAAFPLLLRIPGWAESSTLELNGGSALPVDFNALKNRFLTLNRIWKDGEWVALSFPLKPRVSHWYRNSAVFEAGPLVFSLPIGENWKQLNKYAEHSADWQITPTTAWNYAVEVGKCDAAVNEDAISAIPFDVKHPPVSLSVQGRLLPGWTFEENSAGPLPVSPVRSNGTLQSLKLIPYGSAKLRITAFPFLTEASSCK
jgi:uncharacterized protein